VKAEHRNSTGLLPPHVIPESKWEVILMDFVVGFPLTTKRHDSIFVIVDTLNKSVHFIPVCMKYQAPYIVRILVNEIVRLHVVPRKIIYDRGSVFTGNFWTSFKENLGTQMNFSTSYHHETNGKTERMNQIIEDMLRMCVMDQQK
jgi:hypothetical protein